MLNICYDDLTSVSVSILKTYQKCSIKFTDRRSRFSMFLQRWRICRAIRCMHVASNVHSVFYASSHQRLSVHRHRNLKMILRCEHIYRRRFYSITSLSHHDVTNMGGGGGGSKIPSKQRALILTDGVLEPLCQDIKPYTRLLLHI